MYHAIEEWLESGEMDDAKAREAFDALDEIMETTLAEVRVLVNRRQPEGALTLMMQSMTFLHAASARLSGITGRLSKWAGQIKNALVLIAQALGATSFSISIPHSVELSWDVPPYTGGQPVP